MPGPDRVNVRNGYRHRDFDTRAGTLDVAIPKLRSGSYFPDWLLERRRRAEATLTSVVATCYLLGVSTRRMEKLMESLGITRLSKSQVSVMAAELDAVVEDFRTRPLDAGPCTFVAADALVLKVREGGRVVNVHALLAAGVNADGHREILGLQVTSAEDGAGWLAFFRDLTARGLAGVAVGAGARVEQDPLRPLPGADRDQRGEPMLGDEYVGFSALHHQRAGQGGAAARPGPPGRALVGHEDVREVVHDRGDLDGVDWLKLDRLGRLNLVQDRLARWRAVVNTHDGTLLAGRCHSHE